MHESTDMRDTSNAVRRRWARAAIGHALVCLTMGSPFAVQAASVAPARHATVDATPQDPHRGTAILCACLSIPDSPTDDGLPSTEGVAV